jgi:hypothetical protein
MTMKIDNYIKTLLISLVLPASMSLASDCGEVPVAPEIVDGTTASVDALVDNSEAVKAFIASADKYLDCRQVFRDSPEFDALDKASQGDVIALDNSLLDLRNSIGESFNHQVKAYKQANP